jgi:DNA-binding transcriptional regulator YhcF (GntR family)
VPPADGRGAPQPTMLSARDVEETLRDRILRGAHPPGAPLPPVRTLAAELGASPSTVGRAVQELARQGWLRVTNRRGTVVSRELPAGETGERALEAAVRRLAVRWRLAGADRDSFGKLVGQVADEVFRPAPRLLFLECNPVDVRRGLEQLQRNIPVGLEPLLLEEARADPARLGGAHALFTPYFHLAEVRDLAPAGVQVVPLNFVPSEETMRTLVEIPADALVGVVAVDDRSRRRLEAIVRQFSPAAVRSARLDDPQAVARLVDAADLVLATNAARLPQPLLRRVRRLLRIGWTMEGGLAAVRA